MAAILSCAVRELHIDLLFLEEFFSSDAFRKWFISKTVKDEGISTLVSVEHSVYELERESDLEVLFQSTQGEVLFLVENKINAQFQPNQAEDYTKRGLEYIRRGKCSVAYTIIFAPENYIQLIKDTQKFDFYIPFESVIEYFSQSQMGDRAIYKIEVLERAIKKAAIGSTSSQVPYQPTEANQGITLFWQKYWEDISQRIPELHMPCPTPKGSAATFIGLAKNILPASVSIYHKFVHGRVDLQFDSIGINRDILIKMCLDKVEKEMTVERSGKSAVVIRIDVPKINPHMFFGDVLGDVRKGQDAALRLLNWFNQNSNLWTNFKSTYPK